MKPQIAVIASFSIKDQAMGNKGKLLWDIPEDLDMFKRLTMGHQIIVGRKTWESIPNNLAGRDVFVLTKSETLEKPTNATAVASVFEALNAVDLSRPIFIIGGAFVYEQFLPYATQLILTTVDYPYEECDTFFPSFDINEWTRKSGTILTEDDKVVVHLLVRNDDKQEGS